MGTATEASGTFDADDASVRAMNSLVVSLNSSQLRQRHTPHLKFENFLPEDLYALLDSSWPSDGMFRSLNESGLIARKRPEFQNKYSSNELTRSMQNLHDNVYGPEAWSFWRWFIRWLLSPQFALAFIDKLIDHTESDRRFGLRLLESRDCDLNTEIILQEDRFGASLPVHQDSPDKILSLIIYVARPTDPADFGTRIFEMKESTRKSVENGEISLKGYSKFELFDEVFAAPFTPNSGFIFVNCSNFWHGVQKINTQGTRRRVILWNLRRRSN
jgi:hypothetical protein